MRRIVPTLVILALSIWYVHAHIPSGWAEVTARLTSPKNLVAVIAGSIVLALADVAFGAGWYLLLRSKLAVAPPLRAVWRDYSTSYALRYLGGYWGSIGVRHVAMKRKLGLNHRTLLEAALLESVVLVGLSALLAFPALSGRGLGSVAGPGAGLLLAGVLVVVLYRVVKGRASGLGLAGAAGAYALGIAVNSAVFALLFRGGAQPWPIDVSVQSLSWLIGQLTPGSVQGLGVREAVITARLGGSAGPAGALFGAVAFRLMTLGGDLLFYLVSRAALSDARDPRDPREFYAADSQRLGAR